MALSAHSHPYGYKNLLVYQKAEELQKACAAFCSPFSRSPHSKTLYALSDQMNRSARSVKQNIVEGWKRNSTKEYYDFLGFSLGADAELEEDCDDIIKGTYDAMGLRGEKGGMGERGEMGLDEVEGLPFYPLPPFLPFVVQLKLRCKELNMLLTKLQKSLENKMHAEHRVPLADRLNAAVRREQANDTWLKRERQKWEKGEEREKGG